MTENSENPLRIAIIGAGIGGLALGIGLVHQNVRFTLYESAGEYATVGAGIGLGPNALKAMDLIDPKLRGMYHSISTGNLKPEKKHVMMEALLLEEGFGEKQGWNGGACGSPTFERTSAHRRGLLDILTSLIPPNSVNFNKRVTNLRQDNGKVYITFQDGEVAESDAVIGCDGIKGYTRGAVLGSKYLDLVQPKYCNKYVYRAVISMDDVKRTLGDRATDAAMFMGPSRNILIYPISKGTEVNLVAFKRDPRPWLHKEYTHKVEREDMLAEFDGIDSRLLKLLELYVEPIKWSLHHHITTPTYYNAHIALLGDSAHATGPHQAAGAGQCFEDALILSNLFALIKRAVDIPTAFHIYDFLRRPRAQKVVETSHQAGEIYSFDYVETGSDMVKITENLNQRFTWIWEHDLEADVRAAEVMFKMETAGM